MGLKNTLKRFAFGTLADLLKVVKDHHSVILVEGPRQVGKTTIVEECFRQNSLAHVAINLEKDLLAKRAIDQCQTFEEFTSWLQDIHEFKPGGDKVLFIDEAQESMKLGGFVRSMKEDWHSTRVILSGSMMSRLFRKGVRYPVGRVTTFKVQGLNFIEYLWAIDKNELAQILIDADFSLITDLRHKAFIEILNTHLTVGAFPEVILSHLDNTDFLNVLLEIFEGCRNDFIRVFGEDQGYLFERAIQAVCDHVGSPSTLTQAVPSNDKTYKDVPNIFSRLEAWHMIYNSPQRGLHPEGTTLYHPKRYLFDPGLLSLKRTTGVPGLSLSETLDALQRTSLGGIIENFVAINLVQQKIDLAGFKKSPSGMEIDFVVKIDNTMFPIECKAALKVKDNHLTGLKSYMSHYKLGFGFFVSLAPFQIKKFPGGKIICLPAYAAAAIKAVWKKHS